MPPISCPDIFFNLHNRELSQTTTIMTTRRWIFFFLSLIAGVGISLFYGWVISPVQYVNTTPNTLRIDFQADYVLMIAEIYQSDQNITVAAQRMGVLGSQPPAEIAAQALSFAQQNGYSAADIAIMQNLVAALKVVQPAPAGATP